MVAHRTNSGSGFNKKLLFNLKHFPIRWILIINTEWSISLPCMELFHAVKVILHSFCNYKNISTVREHLRQWARKLAKSGACTSSYMPPGPTHLALVQVRTRAAGLLGTRVKATEADTFTHNYLFPVSNEEPINPSSSSFRCEDVVPPCTELYCSASISPQRVHYHEHLYVLT